MALVRGLMGYAPAVIVPRLLSLAQITLLTRFIPQAEFGRFVLVVTVGDALDALCCNWIRIVLARYGAGKPDELAEEAGRAYGIYALTALGLALPLGLLVTQFQRVEALPFFASVALYVLVNGLARNSLTMLAVRGLKLSFFAVEAIRTGVGFVAVMALAVTGIATTYGPLITAMNVATGVAALVGTICGLRGVGLRWPRHWGLDRHGYVVPLVAGALIGVALNSSDRMVTEAFAGPAALATYVAAVALGRQPLEFIFSVVNVRTFPELMEAYETGGPAAGSARMADLISVMSLLAIPAALGLGLVAGPLSRTFLSVDYQATAGIVIPVAALAGVFFGFKSFVFDQTFHMTRTIWRNILATVPVTLLGMGLTAVLASRYGAVGCVVSVLVQYGAAVVVSMVQAHRLVPLKPHWDDLGRIALMCAVMTVCVAGALALTAAWHAAPQLGCGIVAGILSYAAAGWLLMPRPVRELLPRRFLRTAGAALS